MSMKKISDLQKALEHFLPKVSLDQIRKLEKLGIIKSYRNSKSGHREYNEEQFKQSVKNCLHYYFNTPIEEIRANDPEVMGRRVKKLMKAVRSLA